MAEAERIIGTPDIPDAEGADGAEPQRPAEGTEPSPGAESTRGDAKGAEPARGDTEGAEPAGGDPAAGDEAAGGDAAVGGRRRKKILVLLCVAVLAYLLDLVSKTIVVAELEHRAPVEIFGDWLKLEVIRNAGAAFSFGEAFTVIFTAIASVVIIVIIRLARKLYSLPWAIALGLLLGGALGNLTDRVFRAPGVFEGAVVDFISPAHFAVFNLADSAIVCGGFLIVILSFKGLDPDGTVHKD
ncbi:MULTISPECIES: signal peptidase II [unclassified Streptomyces]|uniref:signal peptidase II n=1 Tax=unclassified Streptomyces TaxID=2593676 RepID=UPI00048EC29F|nr:signal peptidase II [Streptomyces sp. DpondAA-D4]MYY14743.1 signal peptidase II [Streptomyces sp. SID4912]SCE22544.1 signal peptidase II [Streptomyces sp. DpondAA-D4]